MRFLFVFLTVWLPFSSHAIELPPEEAGADFIRLFETGVRPNDNAYFYTTGFGKGNNSERKAYIEAARKLTDEITGMQKIINTPSFTPFLFNHFEQKENFFRQSRYWGIYRNKTTNIQKQRNRIVSLKILAQKVKEKAEDPDEYITDAKVYYYAGEKKTVYVGKTPIIDLTVFTGNEKFFLEKNGYYHSMKTCKIDKKKNVCVFSMTPVPEKRNYSYGHDFFDFDFALGCSIVIGFFIILFLLFVSSLKKKE